MNITATEARKIKRIFENEPVEILETLFASEYGLWEKQATIARAVLQEKHKKVAVRSCHNAGKSFIAARIVLAYLLANVDSLVVTTAPGWTQVKDILWRELRSAYHGLERSDDKLTIGGNLLKTRLEFSDDWMAVGIATRREGEAMEVAQRMLGFHSATGKILIVVDEGAGVKEPIWNSIDSLLTSDKAQLLAIGNPYAITGSFADLFKKEKNVKRFHIIDTDVPNIKEGGVVIPGLMSPDYPQQVIDKFGKGSPLYMVKVKGEFPKQEEDTLISLELVENAFQREVEPSGRKKLGIDPARFGDDNTVFVVRQSKKVLRKEKYSKEDTMKTAGRAIKIIKEEKIEDRDVFIDEIGIGAGTVDRLKEEEYNINGIKVSREPQGLKMPKEKARQEYYNLRAEAYFVMRDWFKGEVDLPQDDDFLEVANIKYEYRSSREGQIKIESKEKMKKRGLPSPNTADALMLTFAGKSPSGFPSVGKDKEGKLINKQF